MPVDLNLHQFPACAACKKVWDQFPVEMFAKMLTFLGHIHNLNGIVTTCTCLAVHKRIMKYSPNLARQLTASTSDSIAPTVSLPLEYQLEYVSDLEDLYDESGMPESITNYIEHHVSSHLCVQDKITDAKSKKKRARIMALLDDTGCHVLKLHELRAQRLTETPSQDWRDMEIFRLRAENIRLQIAVAARNKTISAQQETIDLLNRELDATKAFWELEKSRVKTLAGVLLHSRRRSGGLFTRVHNLPSARTYDTDTKRSRTRTEENPAHLISTHDKRDAALNTHSMPDAGWTGFLVGVRNVQQF